MSSLIDILADIDIVFTPLGEVTEMKRGKPISKKNATDGGVPVVAGGKVPSYYHNESNREGDTIVVAGSGMSAGFVSWWDCPIYVSDAFSIKSTDKVDLKYVFYFLKMKQDALLKMQSSGGIPHVYIRNISPLEIPIPCPDDPEKSLAIQAEIVRILDTFTDLVANLKKELTARREQFEYYRNKLLSPDSDGCIDGAPTEQLLLGEVATIKTGQQVSKNKIAKNPGEYPVINSGKKPLGFINEWNTNNDPIGITSRGAGVGSITWQEGKYYRGNLNYSITINKHSGINKRFLFHMLLQINESIKSLCTFEGIPALNAGSLKKLKLAIPCAEDPEKSLAFQAEIVEKLDKFDTLINSTEEGLPKEIELRQKQYEYYRDMLFVLLKKE